MIEIVQFGKKEIQLSQICAAKAPARAEMASFCRTLKLLVEGCVNILEAFRLVAKSTQHPWLIALLSFSNEGIREGETMVGAISTRFTKLIESRIEELIIRKPRLGNWRTLDSGEWALPDFFGEFADLLSMIDVGEETGSLDVALEHARELYLGKGGYGEKSWGRDIAILNRAMGILFVADLPPHAVLRILSGLPSLKTLHGELQDASLAMEDCDSLSEAFAQTNGRLADPVYLGLIEAGEKAGAVWAVFDGMNVD